MLLLVMGMPLPSEGSEQEAINIFVGSLACKKCHPEEYANFMTYAKKTSDSIRAFRTPIVPAGSTPMGTASPNATR